MLTRTLVQAAVWLACATSTLFFSNIEAQNCPYGIRPRKEFRDLSSTEWNTLVEAMYTLMETPGNDGVSPTLYDQVVDIHLTYANWNHGYAPFFSWHRRYSRHLEYLLQQVNPSVMLAYWDWDYDSQNPAGSMLMDSNHLGGNGNSQGCVVDGNFAGWTPAWPNPHCLARQYIDGNSMGTYYSIELINSFITDSASYNDLRLNIEAGPHAQVHNSFGGDFPTMHSVNDPAFWFHHAKVDKIWADWQAAQPALQTDYEGPGFPEGNVGLTDILEPWPTAVGSVLNTLNLCYYYQPLSGTGQLLARRSFDTLVRRQIPQVPSSPINSGSNSQYGYASSYGAVAPASYGNDDADQCYLPASYSNGGAQNYASTAYPSSNSNTPDNTQGDDGSSVTDWLYKLTVPPQTPQAWLEMNNYSPDQIAAFRQQESSWTQKIGSINNLSGYTSPVALINRPDLLQNSPSYDPDTFDLSDYPPPTQPGPAASQQLKSALEDIVGPLFMPTDVPYYPFPNA